VTLNPEDKLQQRFEWTNRWTVTDMGYVSNCVFVGQHVFNINMSLPPAWLTVRTSVIVTTKSTRATSHAILDAITAMGVVDIELRIAEKPKY
ncbi:hypothetical protein CU098_006738, partial [Rhizopus stolonifer]